MAFSLRETFKTLGRQFNYRLELSGMTLSEPVEKELKAKGWQMEYQMTDTLVPVPAMAPGLPVLTVKDRNGIGIHEPGNGANRDRFNADLREAAARQWLRDKPPVSPNSHQPG